MRSLLRKDWLKSLAIFGSAQVWIQGLGFLSGIAIVRLLTPQDYALYTLANTMLGTITILSDGGGIANGAMATGGRVWQDRQRLGSVIVTALQLRIWFAAGTMALAIPILLWILRDHGASWVQSVALVLALLCMFYISVTGGLYDVVIKLHQKINVLAKLGGILAAVRLAAVTGSLAALPSAATAIFANALPQLWANRKARALARDVVDWHAPPDPKVRREILGMVWRTLPGAVYYCINGQLSIWLVAAFGNTAGIAQVGALSRIAQVLNILSTLIMVLAIPRFARLPIDRGRLLFAFTKIISLTAIMGVGLILFIWFFPWLFLNLLGQEYHHLARELLLSVSVATVALLAGVCQFLCAARGWIMHPLLLIPLCLVAQVFLVTISDFSTVSGVLIFNLLSVFVTLMLWLAYGYIKIMQTACHE